MIKSAAFNNKSKAYVKEQRGREKPMKASRTIPANPYQGNPAPGSADRSYHQNFFRVDMANYFKVEPFLHFF